MLHEKYSVTAWNWDNHLYIINIFLISIWSKYLEEILKDFKKIRIYPIKNSQN